MAGTTYEARVAGELAGKAVIWGPAVAGALLLGPVGILLGLMTSVGIVTSGGGSGNSPAPGEKPNPQD